MVEVATFGETMVLLGPRETGPMKYAGEFIKSVGGAESNVAIGLARLGHQPGWISRLGADPHGDYVESFVRGEGVDVSEVTRDPDAPTGLMFKERRALGESHVYYYRHDSAASRLAPETLPESYIANAKILHVTGITPALSESCRAATDRAIEIAREHGVTVSFDPNIRYKLWDDIGEGTDVLLDLAGRADIVFPGIEEGEALTGTDDPAEIAGEFRERGASTVVVKLGAEGAFVADGSIQKRIDAYPVERVVDPVGAGDGFAAGFLAGWLEGEGSETATRMGAAVGAFATTVTGDVEGFPTREELDAFVGKGDDVRTR